MVGRVVLVGLLPGLVAWCVFDNAALKWSWSVGTPPGSWCGTAAQTDYYGYRRSMELPLHPAIAAANDAATADLWARTLVA